LRARDAFGAKTLAPKHLVLFILGKTFELIEHNDKIIVALSGIAVAAFTGTLWWSTKGLWRVTNDTLEQAEKNCQTAVASLHWYRDFLQFQK
jgi:hypothetical protein